MRIAYLVPSIGTQEGQGSANLELLKRIAAAGHEVDVFTSNGAEHADGLPGVRVRAIPRLPAWQLGNQFLCLATTSAGLRRARYDLIHADAGVTLRHADVVACHTLNDRWLALPDEVWREPGARGAHAAVATRFKARLEVRQYRRARAVLANSTRTAQDLVARGVDAARVTVVPFGVDAERFRPPTQQERLAARASFGIAPDLFVVAFVGAHGPRKGLPVALDALALAPPGEHLLVAGETRGGEWARAALERGLPVTMPGKLADVRAAYWAADVLAYPSRYDSFGMAVLEAMACGLPVIVSREAGSHEIVRDAGSVLTDLSGRALRAALDAMRTDEARRVAMGRRAREIARTRTWDEAGAIVLNRYAELSAPTDSRATSRV